MLLGLVSLSSDAKQPPALCILPDKPSSFSVPVPLDSVLTTDFAVHFLSVEEGFLVTREPGSPGLIVSPVPPAKLYLSPNRPERPGFSVSKLKVERLAESQYKLSFDRDRGWEPWTPNIKLY